MSLYAKKNHFYKSKNPRRYNKNLNRLKLKTCNLSKPQSLKRFFISARQSCKLLLLNDYSKFWKLTLWKTFMNISAKLERQLDDNYKDRANNNFYLFFKQSF